MLRHVSTLAFGHLQGIHKFTEMCSLCFNLYGRNFTYMIKIIIIMNHEL